MDASGRDYETPQKIGNSFMNRFSVDEVAAFEIVGIHHLDTRLKQDMNNFYMKKVGKGMKNVCQNILFM